jgi:carbon storage regulator
MLVLSRKIGEKITIGPNIEIVISDVRGRRVCLGITAPPAYNIRRAEIKPQPQPPERRP